MKTMNAHINVDIEYDYIIYNGSNADDVFKFAKDHGILCRDYLTINLLFASSN